jgi:hypothetical protein
MKSAAHYRKKWLGQIFSFGKTLSFIRCQAFDGLKRQSV